MARTIYAWPPVGATAALWTLRQPVSVSRSMFGGEAHESASQPARRLVRLTVSALSGGGAGAGYLEALARLIGLAPDGGAARHWVRLNAYRINRRLPVEDARRQAWPLEWEAADVPLDWTIGDDPFLWLTAEIFATAGTADGWPILTVTGLPPNSPVALPGEWVTVFAAIDGIEGQTAMILRPAVSDGDGVAVLRLLTPITLEGERRAALGTVETGVFRVTEAAFSPRVRRGDWSFQLAFEEVLPAEIPEGTAEVDPWSG
jgi:hypothetical protein